MEANATTESHGSAMDDSSKAELVPPKRPQRTLSDDDFNNEVSQNDASAGDNNDGGSGGNDEDEEGDEDIIEEADKRSKFMMKGGSHSIQKVLKGEARKKKGFSRFDRRALAPKKGTATIPVPASKAVSKAPSAPSKAEEETAAQSQAAKPQQPVDAAVMESLGDSYSENIYDTDDGEEFAAEVERRSKFIAKGGSHSIKKVLAGEARGSAGKSGPSRINRRNIQPKASPADDEDVEEVEESSGVDNEELDSSSARRAAPADGPRTPMRTISCESTDSQIEDEASRRSMFMLKGASHSIRNLLSGKAKKEKRGSALDRRKLHFKHEADAVHYTETQHAKPEEINAARLKAEAEAKARLKAKKASRFGKRKGSRPVPTAAASKDDESSNAIDDPSSVHDDTSNKGLDDSDAALEAEADRRALMFKGGSHSIRHLFAGKTKKKDSSINRFNRRKMSLRVEADAVHYTEKPHLKPAEINARHQEEAARLRAQAEAQAAAKKTPSTANKNENKTASAPPRVPRRTVTERESSQLDDEEEVADVPPADLDDDTDADDDILEEADKRSKFMMKGGSYSIQKVLKGEARAKKGVTRFDRRKMHFNKASEAVHSHDQEADQAAAGETAPETEPSANNDDSDYDLDNDSDADLLEEADKRSKFMMKGGSHSIQKVLRGEARVKKEGVTRFDRRKMHFNKAAAGASNPAQQDQPEREPEPEPESPADEGGSDYDLENDSDADLLEEADKRSKFMMKGGSYSIQKVLRGDARVKKEGVTRVDRRKMHFKKASEAVHSHDNDSQNQQTPSPVDQSNEAPAAPAEEDDSDYDLENDSDADILEEADKRSKFMMKGGSYSIQKVLRGDAKKKEGVTRFDRRKMHFNKASEAVHSHDNDQQPPAITDEPNQDQELQTGEEDSDYDLDNDSDADLIEEADKRSKFMMKGGSHSIQKVLRGEARVKKEGVTRFDRRKMHFNKASEAVHSHDNEGSEKENNAFKAAMDESGGSAGSVEYDEDDADIIEEADKRSKFMMKGGSHSIQKVLRGEARAKKGVAVSRLDRRKMHFNKASAGVESAKQPMMADESNTSVKSSDSAPRAPPRRRVSDDSEEGEDEDADADIIEEADKRSKFMTKGGSYSIQKVLRGEARQKKEGITRFDRRKMHFKHEAEAVHCHDNDPKPQDQPPRRPPARNTTESEADVSKQGDDDSEFDEEELALLAEAEKDPRQMMMLKGASHSIRNIFSGKAKKKENVGAGMQRRKSQLTAHKAPSRPADVADASESMAQDEEVSVSTRGDDDKSVDRRSRFTLKGASNSIRNLLRRPKKESEKESSTPSEVTTPMPEAKDEPSNEVDKDEDNDLDDDDADIIEEADRRSNFMAKGGSYSIQKVLRGNARKKNMGITRFDRRKMHFKKESEAIHSHDNDEQQGKEDQDASPSEPQAKEAGDEENKSSPEAERVDTDATADNDLDLDDDDADLIEEADRRSKFMSKGGSYSIQKVLKGEARAKKGVSRFDRRKMHFKKEAQAVHSHDSDAAPQPPQPDESQTNKSQSELLDALASGAPAKGTASSAANAKMPSRRVSDGMEDENSTGDAGEEEDAEPDRRSRFTLKGASHSIKKVLAGKARTKKESGVSRLDRRRIHLKSKSTPRGELPPGK